MVYLNGHWRRYWIKAIVPPIANMAAIMYSIILSNVVGRLQHTSMIATAHEHAPHTMSNIHSTKFLIFGLF